MAYLRNFYLLQEGEPGAGGGGGNPDPNPNPNGTPRVRWIGTTRLKRSAVIANFWEN